MKMKNSLIFTLLGVLLGSLSATRSFGQEDGAFERGGIILASVKEQVTILDPQGNPLAAEKVKAGALLTDGHSVETGEGAEAMLLFSNGTVVTVEENTKIKIDSFLQEPFEPGDKKLEDLKEEPSASTGLINLDVGSLVVQTKKLNKKSNFDITSPLGTAGIRGTQFGIGFSPTRGMSLDVTESTVSFSPRGGGRPSLVGPGRGLTAPMRGLPSARAVNPVTARRVGATNGRASRSTRKLPLRFVNKSMKRASAKKPPSRRERTGQREARTPDGQVSPQEEPNGPGPKPKEEGQGPKQSEGKGNANEPEPTQPGGGQASAPEKKEERQPGEPSRSTGDGRRQEGEGPKQPGETSRQPGEGRSTDGQGVARPDGAVDSTVPGSAEGGVRADPAKPVPGASPNQGSALGAPKEAGPKPKPVLPKALAQSPLQNAPENVMSEALENNVDLTQARKTGKVGKMTKALTRLALSAEQTNFFYSLSPEAQSVLMAESPEVAGRVLKMDGLSMSNAFAFFDYSSDTRGRILGLSDEAAVQILDQGLDEGMMLATLTEPNLAASGPDRVPTILAPEVADQRVLALAQQLKDSGNREVIDELKRLSGGVITEELIRKGEAGAILLNDYAFSGAAGSGPVVQPGSVMLGNPFYKEITSLFQKLESDLLASGSPDFVGGRNLLVPANSQALAPYLNGANGKTIALSASENLIFEGDFEWGMKQENSARLVVMSGGALNLAKGMTLKSATSDLLLSSRDDLLMDGVKVDVSKEASVRGMRDVTLNNVEIGADTLITIKATRNLNVDGLIFSRSVSNVLMEATTVRLSNVSFPASSTIRLNSLKGPIDGKYPNFGTAVPAAQQIGRVNFIQNVSSGANALNTRQAFDTYGNNISIGKIVQP